jgi:hypothetical protein
MLPAPFYLDWTFWAAAIAIAALVLSQMPPLYVLFRTADLDLEAFDRIHLSHSLGNSSAALHIIITNRGGQETKIKSITLTFKHSDGTQFELPGRGYFQNSTDANAVILTPFRLSSKNEWGHIINFFNPPPREEEREIDKIKSAIRNDILPLKADPANDKIFVEAGTESVALAMSFFNKKFKWKPGEYEIFLNVKTDSEKTSISRRYRTTMFESDAKQLFDYTERYKYGGGVYYPDNTIEPVFLPLLPI